MDSGCGQCKFSHRVHPNSTRVVFSELLAPQTLCDLPGQSKQPRQPLYFGSATLQKIKLGRQKKKSFGVLPWRPKWQRFAMDLTTLTVKCWTWKMCFHLACLIWCFLFFKGVGNRGHERADHLFVQSTEKILGPVFQLWITSSYNIFYKHHIYHYSQWMWWVLWVYCP